MPYTLRLTGDGVAIHGSQVRWGAATHGCVGVPSEFARHLFAVTKVGDPVLILRSKTG
jgi:lipoprotein-anchoring transpeptidase ErfK/SrfK